MTIELIHNKEPGTFKKGMDIKLSSDSDFSSLEGRSELFQEVKKAIVTSKQADGYGTNLYKLRGKKNKDLIKSLGILSILESLQYLKSMQTISLGLGRINEQAKLISVERVQIDTSDLQKLKYAAYLITFSSTGEEIISGNI